MEEQRPIWFLGARIEGRDLTDQFISEGYFETNPANSIEESYINSILPGDKVFIKSNFTRKHELPFDNKGKSVAVMALKAEGTVKKNFRDGRRLIVEWRKIEPRREWYSYTYRGKIWKVQKSSGWRSKYIDALFRFALEGEEQDFSLFFRDEDKDSQINNEDTSGKLFQDEKVFENIGISTSITPASRPEDTPHIDVRFTLPQARTIRDFPVWADETGRIYADTLRKLLTSALDQIVNSQDSRY